MAAVHEGEIDPDALPPLRDRAPAPLRDRAPVPEAPPPAFIPEATFALQWEYFVSDLGEDPTTWRRRLENLGRQGWELVSTHERLEPWNENTGKGTGRSSLKDRPQRPNGRLSVIAILKRPDLTGRR